MSAPLEVAMREIDLEPSSGEPPLRVYDCSGPYTDPGRGDRHHGRPARAAPRLDPRPRRRRGGRSSARSGPRITASSAPTARGGVQPFPNVRRKVLRAKPGANVSQMHYARRGIITPEMEYVAIRENLGREHAARATSATARISAPRSPITSPPNSSATRSRAAARSSRSNINHPESEPMAIGRNFLVKINANIGNSAPSPATSPPRSTRWSGRSAGAPTR